MFSDAMSVDSGCESEYDFNAFEDGKAKPAAKRVSRVSLSGVQVGKPPLKVPQFKPSF